MNEVQIFESEQFGRIRTVEQGNKVLFCGSDVAKALGYSNAPDAVIRHCRCIVKCDIPHPQSLGKTIEVSFIPEGDVYRLITHSKLPAAEQFESWVFDEVLPTIRKTGGYIADTDKFIESYMPTADECVKNFVRASLQAMHQQTELIKEQKLLIEQKDKKIEADKPLVEFADHVSNTSDLIDIGTLAKIAKDEHIAIGRTRLFEWLRSNGYLISSGSNKNQPYQRYIEQGLFKVKEYTFSTPYGSKVGTKTYVTGKGQIYFVEKLRGLFPSVA